MERSPCRLSNCLKNFYSNSPRAKLFSLLANQQDRFLELRDGSQFTNHSEQPLLRGPQSTADIDSDVCYARRDISVGEELTDHYGYYAADEVTPDWLKDLNTRYCPGGSQRWMFDENFFCYNQLTLL